MAAKIAQNLTKLKTIADEAGLSGAQWTTRTKPRIRRERVSYALNGHLQLKPEEITVLADALKGFLVERAATIDQMLRNFPSAA